MAKRARFAAPGCLSDSAPAAPARPALAPLPSAGAAANSGVAADKQYYTVLFTKRSNKVRRGWPGARRLLRTC